MWISPRSVITCLAIWSRVALAQSSNSNSTTPSPSATPSNSSLQVITTTLTSLITPSPSASGSQSLSAYSTTLVLTLTVNSTTFSDGSVSNSSVDGNGNGTLANATEPEPWKEGDGWIPFHIKIDPAFGVLGALLILSGIPVAMLGGKMRWTSVAIASAYSLMLFTLVLILRFGVEPAMQPPSPVYPTTTLRGLYLLACIISSFFGAAAGIFFFNFSKYWVSAAGGFTFGWFLLATREGGLITSVLGRWGLIGSLSVVAFLAALVPVLHDHMVLASTAWIGATAFVLGIDCYTRAGLKEFYIYNLGYKDLFPKLDGAKYPLTQTMIIELGILAAVVLIGAAVQFKLLDILRHRLKQQRDEEEAKAEAEEVAQAAERFKNVGADLHEWEEKHGSGASPKTPGSGGYGENVLSPESIDYRDDNRSSIQLPSLGFEEGRRGKTSSTASLLMRNERYDPVPLHSPTTVNSTPTTLNFPGLGLEEMLSPDIDAGRNTPQSVTGDAELESKLRLLEEVKRARESVHSSLERIRAGTPSPSINAALPSPTSSLTPGINRSSSAMATSLGERSRRGSTTSSRLLDIQDHPRVASQSEWEQYVQNRNVITPPVNQSPGLNSSDTINRGTSQNSQYAIVSDSVARAVDRRERTTSMMELSAPDEWGPRETLDSAPIHASVGMGRRAMSVHDRPVSAIIDGRPQYRESHSYSSHYNIRDATGRSRQSSGQSQRIMSTEELAQRHRKRLSALQEPVTAKIREPLEIASAKAEWERQKRLERAEMRKREADRLAELQEREKKGPSVDKKEVLKSTDEWRRSIASGLDRVAAQGSGSGSGRVPEQYRHSGSGGGDKRMSRRVSAHLAN